MSEETVSRIGRILEGIAERDAIHIAVFPAIAGHVLYPGEGVTLDGNIARTATAAVRLGIVDPFIHGSVAKGQAFYVFMNPGSITGLRHEWTHPAINTATDDHETWIRAFASRWDMIYEELISAATHSSNNSWDNYVVAHGRDLHSSSELGDDHALFWHHLEGLTGRKFDSEHRENFGWSCSC